MNAPYEVANAMAARICGFKPVPAPVQPNAQTVFDAAKLYPHQYTSSNGLVLDCYLEHEEGHDGGSGPNSEESWPESMNLMFALVNGVDISMELCGDLKELIEADAMGALGMDKWNDEYDRAADRAESEAA